MTFQLNLNLAQRWQGRRDVFIPPDSLIDPSQYGVEPITNRKIVEKHIQEWHYLKTCPVITVGVGLYKKKQGVQPASLQGIAIFGKGSESAVPCYSGYDPKEGLDLTRFVLTPECEFNAETWFLRQAFRILREKQPHRKVVLSYSDPMPRTNENGIMVFGGHIGQIYCASNAQYCGRGSKRDVILCRDGWVFADRNRDKIRNQKKGHETATRRLLDAGAPERNFGEHPADWLKRALASPAFRIVKHPGCHAYLFGLDTGIRRKLKKRAPSLPYPKKTAA